MSYRVISQVSDYEKEIEAMKSVTKEEYLASLRRLVSLLSLLYWFLRLHLLLMNDLRHACYRRKSSGFSRGVSKYRGVAR